MTTIQIISINHQYTDSQTRQKWTLTSTEQTTLQARLEQLGVDGHVLLQTCNRVELIYTAESDKRRQILDLWQEIVGADPLQADAEKTYIGNTVSVRYLLKLATGLHSAVLGDDQILAQMKKSWEAARSAGTLSTLLERAYQAFMRYHKEICRETDFKNNSVSLAYHAWLKARNISPLSSQTVLIVGAGDMAKQVMKYAGKFAPKQLLLSNRTRSKAQEIAQANTQVIDYTDLHNAKADVVINCSSHSIERIAGMKQVPSLVIDLALQSENSLPEAWSAVSLEALQAHISRNYSMRMGSLPRVLRILEAAVDAYTAWVIGWQQRRQETQTQVA